MKKPKLVWITVIILLIIFSSVLAVFVLTKKQASPVDSIKALSADKVKNISAINFDDDIDQFIALSDSEKDEVIGILTQLNIAEEGTEYNPADYSGCSPYKMFVIEKGDGTKIELGRGYKGVVINGLDYECNDYGLLHKLENIYNTITGHLELVY